MSDSSVPPIERAIVVLLRPLARLMLRRGVAYGQFAELAKQAFVETARRDFAVLGRKMTVSRVAVLTGLTRKEAKRVLDEEPPADQANPRRRINRAARVLSAWVQEESFRDGRGAPASLAFDGEEGPTFSQLVGEYGGDVTPRAVLDELLRVGAVRRLKDGRLRPVERVYLPHADEGEKLMILGTDVGDLIASIDHNLDAPIDETFFQRKVAYDNLPTEYLPKLRKLLRRDAQALLERFDADMSAHDRDVVSAESEGQNDSGRRRAMVGIYYFEDEADDEQ
ncbi:MAG: hypothetical protein CL908_05430 [Deltaproteobacteria bacterium]|nr:hypothetical protein [Deltaproteobacteria bacterium]